MSISAQNGETLARMLADIADKKGLLGPRLQEEIETDEKKRRGPVVVMLDLVATYGEEMKSLPVPGSDQIDADGHKHNLFDRWKERVKVNGQEQPISRSVYRELFRDMAFGGTLYKQLELLVSASKNEEGAPEAYTALSEDELDAAIGRVRAAIQYGEKALRAGVALWQKIEAIKETCDVGVSYVFTKDDKGNKILSRSTAPVRFVSKASETDEDNYGKARCLSARDITRLNLTKAKDAGGTWTALIKTLEKKKKRGGKDKTAKIPVIETIEAFEQYVAEVVAYAENKDHTGAIVKALANDPAFVSTVGDMKHTCDALYPSIRVQYERLQQEKNATNQKTAA